MKLVRNYCQGKAVGPQSEAASRYCYRLIAPQLCALTLLPNEQLMQVIRDFDDSWTALGDGGSKVRLPRSSAQKEWISNLIRSSGLENCLVQAKARAKRRLEILGDTNDQVPDHLALRAYPVRCLVPQNNYQETNYLLLVAFHLTQGWASVSLAKMEARWQRRSVQEFKSVVSKMLAPRTRKAFMTQVHSALSPSPEGNPRRVILHASEHEESLWSQGHKEGWEMILDLPKLDLGEDRLVIKCATRAHLKIARYQLLKIEQSSQPPRRIEILPRLESLKSKDKDSLIRDLWNELRGLRKLGKPG